MSYKRISATELLCMLPYEKMEVRLHPIGTQVPRILPRVVQLLVKYAMIRVSIIRHRDGDDIVKCMRITSRGLRMIARKNRYDKAILKQFNQSYTPLPEKKR